MKPEQVIEESIEKAKKKGITIIRGPIFIWGYEELPKACDCSGAVLVAFGKAKPGFPAGWLKELCIDILGKDTWWWYRFNFGFNHGRHLQMWTEDKGKIKYHDDDVSKAGARLAKRLGLYKK